MSIISRIVESPREWTGARAVDELLVRMYDEPDRPHDPHLPEWIRDVLVMCDF